MSNKLQLYIDSSVMLPNTPQWINRFEIHSSSSNRVYVVAQNNNNRFWGCSCPGWKSHRKCKHLESMGLPSHERPMEVEMHRG